MKEFLTIQDVKSSFLVNHYKLSVQAKFQYVFPSILPEPPDFY
jgi:hypothetical protein